MGCTFALYTPLLVLLFLMQFSQISVDGYGLFFLVIYNVAEVGVLLVAQADFKLNIILLAFISTRHPINIRTFL